MNDARGDGGGGRDEADRGNDRDAHSHRQISTESRPRGLQRRPGAVAAYGGGGDLAMAMPMEEAYGPEPNSGTFDIRSYLNVLVKQRKLIAAVCAVVTLMGVFYTLLQTPLYRGSVTIEIKRGAVNVSGISGLENESGASAEFYQTQYELLKSRSLAEDVVARLNLMNNAKFTGTEPGLFASVRGWFGASANETQPQFADAPLPDASSEPSIEGQTETAAAPAAEGANANSEVASLQPPAPVGDTSEFTNRGGPDIAARTRVAVAKVQRGLSVEPVRSSRVVRLSFDSPDPRLAQEVANAVAQSFIHTNLQRRFDATSYAGSLLSERLAELRKNLEQSEQKLVRYAQQTGLVFSGQDQSSVVQSQLTSAVTSLGEAEKEMLRRRTIWESVSGEDATSLPQSLETPAIATLRDQRAGLSATYQEKSVVLKRDFPEMVNLRARIAEIDRLIRAETVRIRESLKLSYESAKAEYDAVKSQVDTHSSALAEINNKSIEYNILKRDVDTNRSLYEGLLQRYKEIAVSGGVDSNNAVNNISIVDEATRPGSPYTPNLGLNTAISLMLGLALGTALAFGREVLGDTLDSPEEVEQKLQMPLLGVIPKSEDADVDGLQDLLDIHSPVGEAFRSLRTSLQFSTPTGMPRLVLVTSARPGEGKTSVSIALAKNFALLGQQVLLIDGDLRKPSIHRRLQVNNDNGLTSILTGAVRPQQALQASDQPNLTIMPCGPLPPNPSELLASPNLVSLLTAACEKFDVVVIDGPPVAGLADAPILASIAEGTVMVVAAHSTRRQEVAASLKRLHFARAAMLGIVLNKFDVSQTGYGYGYGYGYGTHYGYGAEDGQPRIENKHAEHA